MVEGAAREEEVIFFKSRRKMGLILEEVFDREVIVKLKARRQRAATYLSREDRSTYTCTDHDEVIGKSRPPFQNGSIQKGIRSGAPLMI